MIGRSFGALAILLGGCSALGLSDDLEQEPCRACEELNDVEPPPACMSWQCESPGDPTAVCVVDLVDLDHDGAPAAECATPERPADCDDDDDRNTPGASEACDLADNDCDDVVDEGALAVASTDLFVEDGLEGLSFARDETSIAAAYHAGSSLRAALLPLAGGMATTTTLALAGATPNPRATAIARAGSDWAVAFVEGSGCPRIVLGVWSGTGTALVAPSGHAAEGLPKAGGTCAGGTDTSPVGAPALAAASARQVLLAFTGEADGTTCDDTPAPLYVVSAQRLSEEGAFTDVPATATHAGDTTDSSPPALVAVSPAFGYLLAYPDGDGIGVHRVAVDGATGEPTLTELYREPCAAACGDVSLALSGPDVALAYRDGDCTEAGATLRLLTLSTSPPALGGAGAARSVEPIAGLRRPVAAPRTDLDEWVLGWSTAAGAVRSVAAQRFDRNGARVGAPIALLETSASFPERVALAPGTSGVVAVAFDGADDTMRRAAAACR